MTLEAAKPRLTDASGNREKILVVDDSRAHRLLLSRTLDRWGYQSLEAESGEDALAICRDHDVELIISDWMMPGMSGIEFCRAFRNLSRERLGYFILLTAQTEREVLAEGLDSGADDFLSKPVSSVELHARLRAGERILNAQRDLAKKNTEITQTLEKLSDAYAAIDSDLKQARRFQQALVPELTVSFGDFDISILYRPSGHVGGDMVGYFPISETELGLYAVDVSGHGVSSALMTARIASYFSSSSPDRNVALAKTDHGYKMLPPHEACARLNSLLDKDASSDLYLTMILARLSTETGALYFCQAGHPCPILQRENGVTQVNETFGMPVGLVSDASYETSETKLEPGERWLIHSDGITECPDHSGAMFEETGLLKSLKIHHQKKGLTFLDALEKDVEKFAGSSDFPDDLSAILVERR